MELRLVPPSIALRETFLRALAEFRREGLRWWLGSELESAERDFAGFVAKKLADAAPSDPGSIPKTHLWGVAPLGEPDAGDVFVGRLSIYHALDDALRREGGHIGYDTVPSFRGRGVATAMLRAALPVARTLGLSEVLITCDDTNLASIRVIEKVGGILSERRSLDPQRALKRYYRITL